MQMGVRQRGVRLGECFVYSQPFRGRAFCAGQGFSRRKMTIIVKRQIGIRQPRIGSLIARVKLDGPLKISNAVFERVQGSLVPQVTALEIRLIGGGIDRASV